MAALIFLLANFLRTVVGEAKFRLSNDNLGYTVDLSRLQGAIFCIAIALAFTVISYLTERSYLSLAEVTLNAIGLVIIASYLIMV